MSDQPPTDDIVGSEDSDDLSEHAAGAAHVEETAVQPQAPQQQERQPIPRRTGVLLDPKDLRDHVGELLRAMLGGYEVDAQGNYTFVHDTARIFITFGTSPVGPTVGVFSITNLEVDFTLDLAAFLLGNNHQMAFGAFSYDHENRAIWLKHTLLGTTLDAPELQATLMAIATTAAQVDDAIRDKFGGRAFNDAPVAEQQKARPPEQQSDLAGEDVSNASGYL